METKEQLKAAGRCVECADGSGPLNAAGLCVHCAVTAARSKYEAESASRSEARAAAPAVATPEKKADKAPALLKFGNAKLSKDIAIFNLPAVVTCGRACPGCYALKAEKRFPAVKVARLRNLAASKCADFVTRISAELFPAVKAGKVSAVRVHESGDFYSVAYVGAWYAIARAFPGVKFYAYTKRLHDSGPRAPELSALRIALNSLAAVPNFTLIDSCQYGPVNYGTAAELAPALKAGAFLCPCGVGGAREAAYEAMGGKVCGGTCKYCQTKRAQEFAPVFIKH